MTCSPSGKTSKPLCPKSTGSVAVSSNGPVKSTSLSSSSSKRTTGVSSWGPAKHDGGLTRLLNKNYKKKNIHASAVSMKEKQNMIHRAITSRQIRTHQLQEMSERRGGVLTRVTRTQEPEGGIWGTVVFPSQDQDL